MAQRTLALGLVTTLALVWGCGQQPQSADDAWDAFRSAYREVESAQEKTALAEDYLSRFPDTENSGSLAGVVAWYRGHEMQDAAGAHQVLATTLPLVTDPEQRFQVQLEMIPLALELGQPADLAAVADELAEHRPLDFSEHLDVSDLAVEHELWPVAEAHAAAALELATAEAFLADHPDDELSPDEAEAKAAKRKVLALANQGWALANSERSDEALVRFEEAAPLGTSTYHGVPNTRLYEFWGRTALARGDAERALELLAPDAVLGDNDDALAAYRDAYRQVHGEEGFDEHLWQQREALATPVDDFTLASYDGSPVNLAELSQDKVLLLAFWFPT